MNKFFGLLFLGTLLGSCASKNHLTTFAEQKAVALSIQNTDSASLKNNLAVENPTINLLNQAFNTDAANKNMVLVISNESDCDFTMDILGKNHYQLPVAAKKSESIVLQQGDYEMKSEVCKSPYKVRKTFSDNTELSIKYSIIKNPEEENSIVNNQ